MFQQVLYILRCDSLVWTYTGADWIVFCVTVITLGAAWTTELLFKLLSKYKDFATSYAT